MKKRNLELHDFKKILKQTDFLNFRLIRLNSVLYFVNINDLNLSSNNKKENYTLDFAKVLLKYREKIFKLKDIQEFQKIFNLSNNAIFRLDKELIIEISRALKKLEWWYIRKNPEEIIPSEYLENKKLKDRYYKERKDTFGKIKIEYEKTIEHKSPFLEYLISEDKGNKIENLLKNQNIPKKFHPYFHFMLWYMQDDDVWKRIISLSNLVSNFQFSDDFYFNFIRLFEKYRKVFDNKEMISHSENIIKGNIKIELSPTYYDFSTDSYEYLAYKLYKLYLQLIPTEFEALIDHPDEFRIKLLKRNVLCLNQYIVYYNRYCVTEEEPSLNILESFFMLCFLIFLLGNSNNLPNGIYTIFNQMVFYNKLNKGEDLFLEFLSDFLEVKDTDKMELLINFASDIPENILSLFNINSKKYFFLENLVKFINKRYAIEELSLILHYELSEYNPDKYPLIVSIAAFIDECNIPRKMKKSYIKKFATLLKNRFIQKQSKALLNILDKIKISTSVFFDEPDQIYRLFNIIYYILEINDLNLFPLFEVWFKFPHKSKYIDTIPDKFAKYKEKLGEYLYYTGFYEEPKIPSVLDEIISLDKKILRQIEYVSEKLKNNPANKEVLIIRKNNLKEQLDNINSIKEKELEKKISDLLIEARFKTLKYIVDKAISSAIKKVFPCFSSKDDDVDSIFTFISFYNKYPNHKDLFDMVISIYGKYRESYKSHLPWNSDFFNRSLDHFNMDEWLSPKPMNIIIDSKKFLIYEERNFFRAMMMGSYFKTCISIPDGSNAFSSYINNIEIAIKVIYVKDETRKIIARRLIGLDPEYNLCVYTIYGNVSVKKHLDVFCIDLAEKCGISISKKNNYPLLFSKYKDRWYDDGMRSIDVHPKHFDKENNFKLKYSSFEDFITQYYKDNKENIIKIFFEKVGIPFKDIIDEFNEIKNHFIFCSLMSIYHAYQHKNHDFFEFAFTESPNVIKKYIIYSYSLLKPDQAMSILFDHYDNLTYNNRDSIYVYIETMAMSFYELLKKGYDIFKIMPYCYNFLVDILNYIIILDLDNKDDIILNLLEISNVSYFEKFSGTFFTRKLFIEQGELFEKIYNDILKLHLKLKEDYNSNASFEYSPAIIKVNNFLENTIKKIVQIQIKRRYYVSIDMIQFLFYHELNESNRFFIDFLNNNRLIPLSCLYLATVFGTRFSKKIYQLFIQELTPSSFVALLITKDNVLIKKAKEFIKNNKNHFEKFLKIEDIVNKLMNISLINELNNKELSIFSDDALFNLFFKKLISYILKGNYYPTEAVLKFLSKMFKSKFHESVFYSAVQYSYSDKPYLKFYYFFISGISELYFEGSNIINQFFLDLSFSQTEQLIKNLEDSDKVNRYALNLDVKLIKKENFADIMKIIDKSRVFNVKNSYFGSGNIELDMTFIKHIFDLNLDLQIIEPHIPHIYKGFFKKFRK